MKIVSLFNLRTIFFFSFFYFSSCFASTNKNKKKVVSLRIDLFGSLALTGIGHGTPDSILMGKN